VGEIDRVATQTAFNGTKLLNGGFAGAVFQIGANAGDSITINAIANSTASNLGSEVTFAVVASGTITGITALTAVAAGDLTISGSNVAGTFDVSIGAIASAATYQERAGQVVAAINDKFGETGVQAYITSGNIINLQSQEGTFDLSGAAADFSALGLLSAVNAGSAGTTGVSNLSVATYSASQIAIALLDDAITTVNTTRSTLGATQSRFESAVASQLTTAENLQASRSRIMDADFAAETANLAKAQILQQSGIAMLAQANAIPQNVLALLQ
jgi:flagellin